jgi:predicted Rossmann fold flavoprotein
VNDIPRNVVIIGAGAAGLLAAGRAAELGSRVLVLEKMPGPGRKLSITGKGRCNLTNIAPLEEFLGHFGPDGAFLRQSFDRFFSGDLVRFLESLGVATITERGGRVFPAGQDAAAVTTALAARASAKGARLKTGTTATGIVIGQARVAGVRWIPSAPGAGQRRETLEPADAVVIATGGCSYPGTGSTGDGHAFARSAGHHVTALRPALVGLRAEGRLAGRLQGLSLKNVSFSLRIDGRRACTQFGEMLFTHFGVSGPIVLTSSRIAVDALAAGKKVEASIDFKPALDDAKLDARLLRDFREHGSMHAGNLMKRLLPAKSIPLALEAAGIPADKFGHQISAEERKRLKTWLKDFRLSVIGHRPLAEAIITAGGVRLKEVNPRTMESRLVKGLYFCGEVLDLNADTGGYNLQAAFSTGWVAGQAAAEG